MELLIFSISFFGLFNFKQVLSGQLLSVFDSRTKEYLAFPEDYLRLVLIQQSESGQKDDILYAEGKLDMEGYVLTGEGQLVPFRAYKKAGAHLNPRNCQLGKRVVSNELSSGSTDDTYELQVFKRKVTHEDKPHSLPFYDDVDDDDDIFDPNTGFDVHDVNDGTEAHTKDNIELIRSLLSDLPVPYKMYDLLSHKSRALRKKELLATFKSKDTREHYKHINSRNRSKNEIFDYQRNPKETTGSSDKPMNTVLEEFGLLNNYYDNQEDNRNAELDIYTPDENMDIYTYSGR